MKPFKVFVDTNFLFGNIKLNAFRFSSEFNHLVTYTKKLSHPPVEIPNAIEYVINQCEQWADNLEDE